jgi:hypothetical protein
MVGVKIKENINRERERERESMYVCVWKGVSNN